MQLTRTADYGIRVMTHLATLPEENRANADSLAAATGTSAAFLGKILQHLVTARLVVSRRGHDGGFQLARPAFSISILDVVTALEGPLCINTCLPGGSGCDRHTWCAAHPVWMDAQAKLAQVLRATSIDALARASVKNGSVSARPAQATGS